MAKGKVDDAMIRRADGKLHGEMDRLSKTESAGWSELGKRLEGLQAAGSLRGNVRRRFLENCPDAEAIVSLQKTLTRPPRATSQYREPRVHRSGSYRNRDN